MIILRQYNLSQSLAQVPVKNVLVQIRGGLMNVQEYTENNLIPGLHVSYLLRTLLMNN